MGARVVQGLYKPFRWRIERGVPAGSGQGTACG